MKMLNSISALRAEVLTIKQAGKRLAFVPTMGNLHQGHLSLVKAAKKEADVVITSIFVNPLQFGANEDFDQYPRTLTTDKQALMDYGCDLVFTPTHQLLYPNGTDNHTNVSVPGLNALHCGQSRPHFFDGVATVVTKLFNLVQPDVAIFGEKDYQQVHVIKQMVADLCLPITVVSMPTVREADGLALSSRNQYLSAEQRALAPLLYQQLLDVKNALLSGQKNFGQLSTDANAQLIALGFQPDYLSICHAQTLMPATPEDNHLVILAAAHLGETRLIDNCEVLLD